MSKPIVYYAHFSPPSRAVLLTVKILGLDVELRALDFTKKEHLSDEFKKINPQHTVPTLIDDGVVIWDSHSIMSYLVSKYAPNHDLYPHDLVTRAKIDQRLHFDSSVIFAAIKSFVNTIIYGGKTDYQIESVQAAYNAYDLIELFLSDSENEYLVGKNLTLADISCTSDLITLESIVQIDASKYPRLSAWLARVWEYPGFQETHRGYERMLAGRISACLESNREAAANR